MIRSYNNLGYYYFLMRNYTKARKYFQEAWKYASNEDVNNLEGTFMSIMNLSNLYVYFIEIRSKILTDPINEINSLVRKIDDYRNNYETTRFNQDLEALEKTAKTEKRKVAEAEKAALKKKIAQEAILIYYRIDIAMGVLKFYNAELFAAKEFSPDRGPRGDAMSIYRTNREIYELYADALKRFDNALVTARAQCSQKLIIKLLLNAGGCLSRIGSIQDAYANFLEAKKMAEDLRIFNLSVEVYFTLGKFMVDYGRELEGPGHLAAALDYYEKAVSIVEEVPGFYSKKLEKVRLLYDDYVNALIRANRMKDAFMVSERKTETIKSILITLSAPEFYNSRDLNDYRNYFFIMRGIAEASSEINAKLEKGVTPDSEEITSLDKKLIQEKKKLNELVDGIEKRGSLLASNLRITAPVLPENKNLAVFKFYEFDGGLYAWKIENRRLESRKLADYNGKNFYTVVSNFLKTSPDSVDRYVLINKTCFDRIRDRAEIKPGDMPPFMFIPSLSRLKYFLHSDNVALNRVYYSGSGLKAMIQSDTLIIDEGDATGTVYSDYSTIIDDIQGEKFQYTYLFSHILKPVLMIKNLDNADLDYITVYSEAALYSGIRTVIFSMNADKNFLKDLVKLSLEKEFSSSQSGVEYPGYTVSMGYRGVEGDMRTANIEAIKAREFRSYTRCLEKRKFELGLIHMTRWKELHGREPGPNVKVRYLFELAKLDVLNDRYDDALKKADEALSIADQQSDIYGLPLSQKIYLLLYTGRISDAVSLMKAGSKYLENTFDGLVYESIARLINDGPVQAFEVYSSTAAGRKSIIEPGRLTLLLAEFLTLYGASDGVAAVMKDWKPDYSLSARETVKAFLTDSSSFGKVDISRRINSILDVTKILDNAEKLKTTAAVYVSEGEGYDLLSQFPVFIVMNNLFRMDLISDSVQYIENSDYLDILRKSHWLDAVDFINRAKYLGSIEENTALLESLNKMYHDLTAAKGMPTLEKKMYLDYGSSLAKLGKYREAYDIALKGARLVDEKDPLNVYYQVLLMDCETSLGRNKEASDRIEKLLEDKNLGDEFGYAVNLIKCRLEKPKAKSNDKKSTEVLDLSGYLGLFQNAVKMINKKPAILGMYNRIDLLKEMIDRYIGYMIKSKNYHEAIGFAEMKKLLITLARVNGVKNVSPDKSVREAAGINGSNAAGMISLIGKYPDLQLATVFQSLPIDEFKERIPENAMVVYFIKNGDDVMVWMADAKEEKTIIFNNVYGKILKIIDDYKEAAIKLKSTMRLSRKLNKIFKKAREYFWSRKKILILATDQDMEIVPFEILGSKNRMDEKHIVVHLSSIVSGLKKLNKPQRKVTILGDSRRVFYNYLEGQAVEESGIEFARKEDIDSGFGHIHAPVEYNKVLRKLFLGAGEFDGFVKGPDRLYIPAVNYSRIGYNDFSIFSSSRNVGAVIINDAGLHDINNAIFVDTLYSELAKGKNIYKAFEKAKYEVRNRKEFNHPVYWAGIRLYLNGL